MPERPATNLRTYGASPFRVAVVHGGPGAAGEVAPVARKLATNRGVLEPLQTAATVFGQTEELASLLSHYGSPPITLIGHSWGAWLGAIIAAQHPHLVAKLILVSSGPFEAKYVERLGEERQSRLTPEEQAEFREIAAALRTSDSETRDRLFAQVGALSEQSDSYDALPDPAEQDEPVGLPGQYAIYSSVWPEAAELRATGRLLEIAEGIRCPVVAIHGDHDPHLAVGVEGPLRDRVADFRMRVLPRCGHTPWRERFARDLFFQMLEEEIAER